MGFQSHFTSLFKFPEICFFYTCCRPNEKIAQIWCFTLTSPFYKLFAIGLSIWENFATIFHLINIKNLSGQLYVPAAPGFWKNALVNPLENVLIDFLKNAVPAFPFPVSACFSKCCSLFLEKFCLYTGDYCL